VTSRVGGEARLRDRVVRELFASAPINVREAGPRKAPPLEPAVRAFPFPFKGALAIANDSRSMSDDAFDAVHGAFADRGLELEATLSFESADACSVGSERAAALHAAGLAATVAGLPDDGLLQGIELLKAAGLHPTCHLVDSPVAAAAGFRDAGVRYFTDSAFVVEKFGEAMDYRSTVRLHEAFAHFDYVAMGDPEGSGTDLSALFEAATDEPQRRSLAVGLFNRPLISVPTPSGVLNVYKRYRGGQRPAAPTLPLQVRTQFLDALEGAAGAVIVEQRLGETALLGQPPESEQRRPLGADVLTVHELVLLDELADRSAQTLLFTTPPRLLDWLALRDGLTFEVDQADDVWLISITGVGSILCDAGQDALEGIAFVVPSTAPKTMILMEGEREPLPTKRERDLANPGSDCVYLPWRKRSWPKL